MYTPKHRRLYPELLRQYKQQEKRIKDCGNRAWLFHYTMLCTTEGTYFSTKLNKR